MFKKSKPQTVKEPTESEKELARLKEERAKCDPDSKEYKAFSDRIREVQEEIIKDIDIENHKIGNDNKSSEASDKKAERRNKVTLALIKGGFVILGCATVPFFERNGAPMTKLWGVLLSSIVKQD